MNLRIKLLIAVTICCVLLLSFLCYQNRHLAVSQYRYTSEKITSALDGFRILQLSDLHNAQIGEDNTTLAARIRALNPDLIVITGDLVDSYHPNPAIAFGLVEQIADICPICYTTGNHELRLSDTEQQALFDALESFGVLVLRNESIEITRNGASLWVTGVDDAVLRSGKTVDSLSALVSKQPEDCFSLVLAHEPHYFPEYCEAGVQLVLCGHAHGGQFRLPFLGGLYAPGQGILPNYTAGEYVQGGTEMIVSRGIGNTGFPFRLFNYPDLVCIDLCAFSE